MIKTELIRRVNFVRLVSDTEKFLNKINKDNHTIILGISYIKMDNNYASIITYKEN